MAASATTPSTPTACLACRSRHLKCDGQQPCSRCQQMEIGPQCLYVASRRGRPSKSAILSRRLQAANANGRSNNSNNGSGAPSSEPVETVGTLAPFLHPGQLLGDLSTLQKPLPSTGHTAMTPSDSDLFDPSSWPLDSFDGCGGGDDYQSLELFDDSPGASSSSSSYASRPLSRSEPDINLESFYYHFYPSYPFVLPKQFLLRLATDRPGIIPDHLIAAMRWIGSLYVHGVVDKNNSSAQLFEEATQLVNRPEGVLRDGFLVQTLLLLLIGLDGQHELDRAVSLLVRTRKLAVAECGMQRRAFATTHYARGVGDRDDAVLAESWRRTWWELYVVDGMIAAVHRRSSFALSGIETDVMLPCEEHEYKSGRIPTPQSLQDLDDTPFSDHRPFSSSAYRISAARNLGAHLRARSVSAAAASSSTEEAVHRVEARLSNWRAHLPASKRDSLDRDCRLDEMMFQAHMITHATSIILHQPLSQLDSSSARPVDSCGPPPPSSIKSARSDNNGDSKTLQSGAGVSSRGTGTESNNHFDAHTRHVVMAAEAISKMITYAVPLDSHSHFFTCVVTLSSVVHLSAWSSGLFLRPLPSSSSSRSPSPPPSHLTLPPQYISRSGSSDDDDGGEEDDDRLRQHVRLNIGALEKLGDIFCSARLAAVQVKDVAREIYATRRTLRRHQRRAQQQQHKTTTTTTDGVDLDEETDVARSRPTSWMGAPHCFVPVDSEAGTGMQQHPLDVDDTMITGDDILA